MPDYKYHIFICEHLRTPDDKRGSCGAVGGKEIRAQFKKRIKELGLSATVRANSAGCLNACAYGPSIVVYPEGVWYKHVSLDDVEEIIQQHILKEKIVDRLTMNNC